MFYLFVHFSLALAIAVLIHELAHALVGRWVGEEIVSINLYCASPAQASCSRWDKPLFELGRWRIGLNPIRSSVTIQMGSHVSARAHAAVCLAGPFANGLVALLFFSQGDQLAMLINLYFLGSSFSDVYRVGSLLCDRRGARMAEALSVVLLVPLALACVAIATWSTAALLVVAAGDVICTILRRREMEASSIS